MFTPCTGYVIPTHSFFSQGDPNDASARAQTNLASSVSHSPLCSALPHQAKRNAQGLHISHCPPHRASDLPSFGQDLQPCLPVYPQPGLVWPQALSDSNLRTRGQNKGAHPHHLPGAVDQGFAAGIVCCPCDFGQSIPCLAPVRTRPQALGKRPIASAAVDLGPTPLISRIGQ